MAGVDVQLEYLLDEETAVNRCQYRKPPSDAQEEGDPGELETPPWSELEWSTHGSTCDDRYERTGI